MEDVRAYLLAVSGAGLLCGIVNRFLGKKETAEIARVITGLFLVLTIMQPLGKINVDYFKDISFQISEDADDAVALGVTGYENAMVKIIKEETGAYILEKAKALGAHIEVAVEVSDDDIPVPVGVCVTGTVAPYVKSQLQTVIEQQLGISKENQQWT